MAIFGPNEAELGGGQQASPFTPTRPVADEATANLVDTASTFVSGGLAALGGQRQQRQQLAFEQQQAEQKNNAITNFQNELLRLDRAVKQGSRRSSDARSRANVLLSEFSEAYPALSGDFRKVMSDVEGSDIMGGTLTGGTEREQMMADLTDRAFQANYIHPGMDEEQQAQGVLHYFNTQQDLESLRVEREKMATAQADLNLNESTMDFERKIIQRRMREAASSYVLNSGEQVRNQAMQIARDFENGTLTSEEAFQLLDSAQSNYAETLQVEIGNDLDPSYLNNLRGPMDMFVDNAREVISGNREATWLETKNRESSARARSVWYRDPQLAVVAEGSRIFQGSPLLARQVEVGMGSKIGDLITSFDENQDGTGASVNPFPSYREGKEAVTLYYNDFFKPTLEASARGQLDEQEEAELDRQVIGLINSASEFAGNTRSLLDFKPLTDTLASSDFGAYVTSRQGLPVEVMEDVQIALGDNYTDEVVPMIRDRWREKTQTLIRNLQTDPVAQSAGVMRTGRIEADFTDIIVPEFDGSSVRFRVNRDKIPEGASSGAVQAAADELNREVRPALNNLVRMTAHLEGNRNYRAAYNDFAEDLFAPYQQEGNDAQSSED